MTEPSPPPASAAPNAPVLVAAFYHFAGLSDYPVLQALLRALCERLGVRGTILLAPEGVNGTLAGGHAEVRAVLAHLRADARLAALEHKESYASEIPFKRLKVRLKREIVSFGVDGLDATRTGVRVPPEQWNALIQDPDVLVIDTRNEYEVGVGTFANAHNPRTDHFRQFPDFARRELDPRRHRRVAMFCTGGIRCEKASAYLLAQGFEEVYQLQGGILKYLEEIPPEQSLWRGGCFVFDERVSVAHGLTPGEHRMCPDCGRPYPAGGECPELGIHRASAARAIPSESAPIQQAAAMTATDVEQPPGSLPHD